MYAKISFSIDFVSDEFVNLVEYGHNPSVKWDDLTDDQQNEIRDLLSEQRSVIASGEHVCPNSESRSYDPEDLAELEELGLID